MVTKRIIPCLDVREGQVTKGVAFQGNANIGDPVDMAHFYYENGADELVFYDITASNEQRDIMINVVSAVANQIFIPFSVGGGLKRKSEEMFELSLENPQLAYTDHTYETPTFIS